MTADILSIEHFAAKTRPGKALLGLDLGTRTIGVALSNGLWNIASPLETIKRTKFTADAARQWRDL